MSNAGNKTMKKGLGRGLASLIGNEGPDPASFDTPLEVKGPRRTLPVAYLNPTADQPRSYFDDGALDELAASIKEKGVLQPLIVREEGPNAYRIIAGERRWRAAQKAGLHELPVVIQDIEGSEALEVAIIENVQRADLTPVEEAVAYRRLMDEFGHTQEGVAKKVSKSRSHVANLLRLLSLPETVQDMVREGQLSMGHARALIGNPEAEALARKIVSEGLTVRDIEALVKDIDPTSAQPKPGVQADPTPRRKEADTIRLERSLSAALGMKVVISQKGEGGEIRLTYPDLDVLDEFLEKVQVS